MRNEENHLDLNNLPDDISRDGNRPTFEDGSSSGQRKKKGGKDESKIYECRFCNLKFCKSQALGGHMNRHRQERETETLNQARQLVYRNDSLAPPGIAPFGFHHTADPTIYRSIYSPRLFPGGSSATLLSPPPPPPPPPYPYSSPSRLPPYTSNQYSPHHPMNEYYLGHVFRGNIPTSQNPNQTTVEYMAAPAGAALESNYTCIGAPVGHGGGSREATLLGHNGDGPRQHLDPSPPPPPPINRFQDHQAL